VIAEAVQLLLAFFFAAGDVRAFAEWDELAQSQGNPELSGLRPSAGLGAGWGWLVAIESGGGRGPLPFGDIPLWTTWVEAASQRFSRERSAVGASVRRENHWRRYA